MWSVTRHPRVALAIAAATLVLVGAACGGDGGSGGETDPTAYPTPSNLGFGLPIYPGAEYDPPPPSTSLKFVYRVVVPGGKSYDQEWHEFYVAEPWEVVVAWYQDTLDDPGLETAGKGSLGGRETIWWSLDKTEIGFKTVHVAEVATASAPVTVIKIYMNTYVVAK